MTDPIKAIQKHAGKTPVPIFDILGELGLGPHFENLSSEISGWIERVGSDDYRIVINRNHAPTRQRFTAAHELAHYIYHRALLGEGVGDNRAYRAENTPLPNEKIQVTHERQANTVAANILMPRDMVEKARSEGLADPQGLAKKFGVSEAAMRIHLGLPSPA